MGIDRPPGSDTADRLKKIADEWQTTFDSITDLVMLLNEEFRIVRVNKAALRFYNLPKDQIIGNHCFALMQGMNQPAELCPLTRLIQTKKHEEAELYDKGKGLWLSVSLDPILDDQRNLTGVVHIVKDISDRKRTEEALRESEAKFRVLAEKSLVGVYLVQDGYFRYVNPCFAKIHGYEVEEILDKKRPRDLPLAEDLPIVEENYRKRITGEAESLRFEFRILTKQQDIKYVEAFGSRTLYQGKPAVIGTLLDITDRKHSEEAIRFERRRFQTLTDNAPFAMALREEDGRFTYINPIFKQLLGYDLADIPNGGIWYQKAYPDPVYRHNVLACWAEDHKKENPEAKSSREFRVTCKDGTQKEIQFAAVRLHSGEIVMSCEDITDRKRAEAALRESEAKYRSVIETSLVGFYIIQDGLFRFVNQRFCEINGYTSEEIVDKMEPQDLIHPEDRKLAAENLRKRFAREIDSIEYSFRVIRKDGQVITVKILGSTIIYQGRPAAVGTVIDITREKTLEAQLRQAQKMEAIGTLAGGIAHDFNNLLMTILGYTSLLLMDTNPQDPGYEKLKIIEEQVQSGADLTRQLLGFARGGKYEIKPTDLNDLLANSLDMFSRTKKEIRTFRKFERELWTVEVDRVQMEQVILNLFVNAWQAMPSGGELYLETRNIPVDDSYARFTSLTPGKYVKISITDTGIGMDEATRERIFEPFFTTKEMSRGTGLGLATAYGVIKNHGGTIHVYSEKEKGTTFTILLPASEKAVLEEKKAVIEIVKGRETLLLVDDQEDVLKVGEAILHRLGYTVLSVKSGEEALSIYKEKQAQIDLVILDMVMPGMSGGEVFSALKGMNPSLKVLLSSGYSLNGQASKIMEMGCNGFIQKPFNVAELSKKVREVLA